MQGFIWSEKVKCPENTLEEEQKLKEMTTYCMDVCISGTVLPSRNQSSVHPCGHCVCWNRPFQELRKTFLASFIHLQDQKEKRGFCDWEAREESGAPDFKKMP